MKKYYCEICSLTFDNFSSKANHIRWKHKDNSDFYKKIKKSSSEATERRYGKLIQETVGCFNPKCSNKVEIKYREKGYKKEKYFCCQSCSNSNRKITEEGRNKISEFSKQMWKNGVFDNVDMTTGNNKFSSKVEREIIKFIKEKHPEDE